MRPASPTEPFHVFDVVVGFQLTLAEMAPEAVALIVCEVVAPAPTEEDNDEVT